MSNVAIHIQDGVKVAAKSDLASMTTYVLLDQEDWFEQEMAFVRAFALPGMYALDIGANHGVYALAFASRLRGNGHVWAFEPAFAPFALLSDSTKINEFESTLTPIKSGLSDRPRAAEIFVSSHSELNSLHAGGGLTESVRLEALDELLAQLTQGHAIDFVKLDAEGEEPNILKGGVEFFTKQSPLVMFEVKHGNEWNHGLCEALEAFGYGIYRLVPGLNALVPVDTTQGSEPFQLNLFAAKPDRAEVLASRGLLALERTARSSEVAHLHWEDAIPSFGYATPFVEGWRKQMNACDAATRAEHAYALDAYVSAMQGQSDANRRLSLLKLAAQGWTRLHERAPRQLAFALCLARATYDLGERGAALGLLMRIVRSPGAVSGESFALPFLPPLRTQDLRPIQRSASDWMNAMLLDAIETWRSHSSFFTRDSFHCLQPGLDNPNLSAAMRRRSCLHALRSGVPFSQAHLLTLKGAAKESLNATLWRNLQERGTLA